MALNEFIQVSNQHHRITCISMVNAVNNCSIFICRKERGTLDIKGYWGIKMNDSCTIYLKSYFQIDYMDQMINNSRLFYRL
jgi:hypothetical protein